MTTSHPHPYSIRRITVYTDVCNNALLEHITASASLVRSPTSTGDCQVVLVTEASLHEAQKAVPSSCSCASSLAFIREWERARADFKAAVDDPLVWMERLECFITATHTINSAPVAYALHCLQIPVLSLAKVDSAPEASLPIERVLYRDQRQLASTVANAGDEATRAAGLVDAFFAALSHSGMAKALAVELTATGTDDSAADVDTRQLTDFLTRTSAYAHLALPSPDRLIFVDEAAFPAWLSPSETNAADSSARKTTWARVAPAYQPLIDTVRARDGHLSDLLTYNPQLVGALCALNRYENRGLVRTLVQQGFTLVYLNFVRTTAQTLTEVGEKDTAQFVRNLITVLRFESHWLELPLPRNGVVVARGADGFMTSDAMTTAELPAWLTALSNSTDQEGKAQLFALLPWLPKATS